MRGTDKVAGQDVIHVEVLENYQRKFACALYNSVGWENFCTWILKKVKRKLSDQST